MKKLWLITSGLLVTGLLGFFIWIRYQSTPPQSKANPITFVVYPGQPAGDILDSLFQAKLIRSKTLARIYLFWTSSDSRIRPGSYTLSPSQNLTQIFQLLTHGPQSIWVTLPEGWRREQMASRLSSLLPGFDSASYLAQTATLEGQLFPDTYLLPPDISANNLISLQTATFTQKTQLDIHLPAHRQVLILASLIERESRSADDRAIIAGILLNRLQAGWPLQVDATVQYARDPQNGKFWSPLTNTRYPSLFNTYLHPGLPPSPICNPSLSSINAARSPQNTTFWFYLHEPNGTPHYAATLGNHQANIDKYLNP